MNETNDIKSDYLKSLYGIRTLSTAEEHELAEKISQGDEMALEKLVTHNLRFVPHVVTKMTAWQHSKMPKEDILAIGNLMLLTAAKRWVPHKNVPFAGYARPFIERGVKRELDNTSNAIRIPVNIMEELKRMNYNERALTQSLGQKPTVYQLAEALDCKPERIHQLRGYINREPISLDNLNNESLQEESDE